MILMLIIVVGAAMAIVPWTGLVPQLPSTSWNIMSGCDLVLLVIVAAITASLRFFRKTSANMAYVCGGGRGPRIIRADGAFVVPVVHHLTPVSLQTTLYYVQHSGSHDVITKHNPRVNLCHEF